MVGRIPDDVFAGQRIYSPLTLRLYDVLVLGISNHFLWRCPTATLREMYDRNIGQRHLDIGVGTGYFLKHARWPVEQPQITLLDLNTSSLAAAANRIAEFHPRTVRANALAPLPEIGTFDSVALCYLLHCLPGRFAEKAVIFDNVKPLLVPGARVFGATILPEGETGATFSAAARKLLGFYNAKGIFHNREDRLEDLRLALTSRFDDVKLETKGTVALFEARAGGSAGRTGSW